MDLWRAGCVATRTSGSEVRAGETDRRQRRHRAPVRPYDFNVRLTPDRPCMLVVIGTTSEGKKELLGLLDGERESKLSWKDLLLDLKQRGLKEGPELAVGDGALGFWAALREVYPKAKEQRCWVHKTANILDKMPKKVRKRAKEKIHGIYMAETKKEALEAFDEFINLYEVRYPKACTCLKKDKDVLFTFYDFPVEHWRHIRSTNPIESTFATVRHRTRQTKGCGSREAKGADSRPYDDGLQAWTGS